MLLIWFSIGFIFYNKFTLYYRKPTVTNPEKEGFCKNIVKKEKMPVTSIFFSFNVFNPIKDINFVILPTFNLRSANALNLVKSEILSSGKGLLLLYNSFELFQKYIQVHPFPSFAFLSCIPESGNKLSDLLK